MQHQFIRVKVIRVGIPCPVLNLSKPHREDIRRFVGIVGCLLMAGDAAFSWFFAHHWEHLELFVANTGKTGAALAGASIFFEKVERIAQAISEG